MKRRNSLMLCIIIGVFLMTGCSILNPYKSSFQCPDYENGKCTSVRNAYEEDTGKQPSGPAPDTSKGKESKDPGLKATGSSKTAESEYQKEVYGKLSSLLRAPKTPMVTAPKVMRVMLLPYKGESGELYMARYAYVMIDDPKWVMGDYLTDDPTSEEE